MLCRLEASRKAVEAGLLAKSVVSDASHGLTPRIRQQAGSYRSGISRNASIIRRNIASHASSCATLTNSSGLCP